MPTALSLKEISCPICNSISSQIFLRGCKNNYTNTDDYFDIVECNSCSMKYISPAPTIECLNKFYNEECGYYLPSHDSVDKVLEHMFGVNAKNEIKGIASTAAGKFQVKCSNNWLESNHYCFPDDSTNNKLLEIGCSWGQYLKIMEYMGWDVCGFDFSKNCVDFGRDELMLDNIFATDLESHDLGESLYDMVNATMVLEHLYQPRGTIVKLHKALKTRGKLYISVPNIDGIDVKIYGKYAYILHPPFHLNHFTPSTLSLLLNEVGFDVHKIIYHGHYRDILVPLTYIPFFKSLNINSFVSSIPVKIFSKILVKIFDKFAISSRFTIICSKK